MWIKYKCLNCNTIKNLEDNDKWVCSCNVPNIQKIGEINTPEEVEQEDKWMLELGKVYEEIIVQLKSYSDINERFYPLIALWIIGTYTHKQFETFPLLFINASKGSGKSRLLKLIMSMAWNGKVVIDLREAALFRTAQHCSIGIDEFENVNSKEYSTLRTLLNAAYKKGSFVERMHKVMKDREEKQEVERFPLYTPVALANIWGMEEVLSDRCITLIIDKSSNKAITKLIENFDSNIYIKQIKRTLDLIQCSLCSVVTDKNTISTWNSYIYTKYTNNTDTLTAHTTEEIIDEEFFKKIDQSEIFGRNLELFFPLFVLANTISTEVFDEILKIAKEIIDEKKHEEYVENRDVQLLDFISKVNELNNNFKAISELTKEFKISIAYETDEMNWLSSKWIGRALKRMNLIKEKRRTSKGVEVILNIGKAKEKLEIYKDGEKE